QATLSATTVPNPGYKRLASFTSGGPRNVDSAAKPDVTAPGVSVQSTAVGTGNDGTRLSGTSMAAPMTAGTAALVRDAHADWSVARVKAAIMNTANPTQEKIESTPPGGYDSRMAGTGVVDARRAVEVSVIATTEDGTNSLSFGQESMDSAFGETLSFTLENTGASDATYDLAPQFDGPDLGSVLSLDPSSVTVPAGGSETIEATLSLSETAVRDLPPATDSNFGLLETIKGAVVAAPSGGGDGLYSLRTPFLVAPRGLSDVTSGPRSEYTDGPRGTQQASVPVSNTGIHSGTVDVYGWGIEDPADQSAAEGSLDIRAAGVQTLPREALCGDAPVGACGTADDRSLIFAVNMHGLWANPAVNEVDIAIDSMKGPATDFFVVGVDLGAVLAGAFDGRFASIIFDAAGNVVDAWVAQAPMNGSTMLLPVLASEIGMDKDRRFDYTATSFSIVPSGLIDTTDSAEWRSHKVPASSGDFLVLGPGQSGSVDVSIQRRGAARNVLGWMFVTHDDAAGAAQADLIPSG
ncbi:MAG: S8 family serine peptidase, partial [Actinomycetota bacterium]